MGELLPEVSQNKKGLMMPDGFIYRGDITTNFGNNFNNCMQTGYYRIHGAQEAQNSPGYFWGGMLVLNCGGYVFQHAFSTSPGGSKFRVTDGIWSGWFTIGG